MDVKMKMKNVITEYFQVPMPGEPTPIPKDDYNICIHRFENANLDDLKDKIMECGKVKFEYTPSIHDETKQINLLAFIDNICIGYVTVKLQFKLSQL